MESSFGKRKYVWIVLLLFAFTVLAAAGCGTSESEGDKNDNNAQAEKKKEMIVIAGSTWDSSQVNAQIASFIIKNGFSYKTDIILASSEVELQSIAKGDLDIRIENWTKSYGEEYFGPIEDGTVVEVAEILKENMQGLYVPTYVIKGDSDRGIEPFAPDLQEVADLEKYWELFKDPEDPSKGRIVGAPTTWSTDKILPVKIENYGLDEYYNYFRPGSGPALDSAIAAAVKKGEPVVAYYWEPTWLMGKYDMTLLAEPEYTEEKWNDNFNCAFPADKVTVTVHKSMLEDAPEVVELLEKFEMTSSKMNEILAYMQDNEAESEDAAIWYLENNKDIWTKWVPEDVAGKVEAAL
ncbi:MAG: ABC transporter substrate-binding protein [Peptococcaceae bacterium]